MNNFLKKFLFIILIQHFQPVTLHAFLAFDSGLVSFSPVLKHLNRNKNPYCTALLVLIRLYGARYFVEKFQAYELKSLELKTKKFPQKFPKDKIERLIVKIKARNKKIQMTLNLVCSSAVLLQCIFNKKHNDLYEFLSNFMSISINFDFAKFCFEVFKYEIFGVPESEHDAKPTVLS